MDPSFILESIQSHNEDYKKKHGELHFLEIDYKKFSRKFYRKLRKFDVTSNEFIFEHKKTKHFEKRSTKLSKIFTRQLKKPKKKTQEKFSVSVILAFSPESYLTSFPLLWSTPCITMTFRYKSINMWQQGITSRR